MRTLQLHGGSPEEISAVRQDIALFRRAYKLAIDTVEGRRPPDIPAKAQGQAQPKAPRRLAQALSGPPDLRELQARGGSEEEISKLRQDVARLRERAQPKAQPTAPGRLAQALGPMGPPPRAQSAQPSPAQPKAPRRSWHESSALISMMKAREIATAQEANDAEMTRRAMYTRKSTAIKQGLLETTIDEITAVIEMLTSRLRKWAAENPQWRRGG